MIAFLLDDEPERDEASWTKAMVKGKAAPEMLAATIAELDAVTDWTAAPIRAAVEAAAVTAGLVNDEGQPQLSKAQAPVRVATTGRSVGPAAVRVARGPRARAHPRAGCGPRPASWPPRPDGRRGRAGTRARRPPAPPAPRGSARLVVAAARAARRATSILTFVQVYRASTHDGAREADAIIVLGAAQ